jgi:transposase
MRKLKAFELGYIAGMIDGEGHVIAKESKCRGKLNEICIGITNTNLQALEKIREWLGCGNICTAYRAKPWHDCYCLLVQKREDVKELAEALRGKVIIKNEKIEKLLKFLEEHPQRNFPKDWVEDEVEFLKRYYRKMTCSQMAQKLGRSKEAVHAKLKEMKLRKGRMTEKQEKLKEKAITLFERYHYSTRKIAKLIGVSKSSVGHWLWGRWTIYRRRLRAEAIKLWEEKHLTYKQIAHKLNLPEGTITRWLSNYKKIRPPVVKKVRAV